MIEVVVVDTSAAARSRLADRVTEFQRAANAAYVACPQLSLKPLSLHEIKFCSAPDIVIIGRECLQHDITEIATIRKALPKSKIVAELAPNQESFVVAEKIAKLGADDAIYDSTTSDLFLMKLILLYRRGEQDRSSNFIVVDSGKGGMGVTTIVAGLGELCASLGKKVVIVDLDSETQDLSRFIQSKPFINENLDAILAFERPLVLESVQQCVYPVWKEESNFCLVPPPLSCGYGDQSGHPQLKALFSFFETLDKTADLIIVDSAGLHGEVRHQLARVADKIIFVLQSDPSAMFGALSSLRQLYGVVPSPKHVLIVNNQAGRWSLPPSYIKNELSRITSQSIDDIQMISMPYCRKGGRWPGSGGTLYSEGTSGVRYSLKALAAASGILSPTSVRSAFPYSLLKKVRRFRSLRRLGKRLIGKRPALTEDPSALSLPAPDRNEFSIQKPGDGSVWAGGERLTTRAEVQARS